MIIETTEYNTKLALLIIQWYFIEMPLGILRSTLNYMKSFAFVFSFLFLLKTLIAPWKNQLYGYPSKGFDIQKILEVFVSNAVSRIVGMTMRLVVLVVGLLVELLTLVGGMTLFVVWLASPVIFVGSIIGSL